MRTVQRLMSLHGRVALVTGGAGHIGAAAAMALAEAGAAVAIADRETEAIGRCVSEIGAVTRRKLSAHVVELADEATVRTLPEEVRDAHGRLDVIVNCAAFVGTSGLEGWAVPFEHQSSKAWRMAIEVNLTATFVLVQAALPLLRASGHSSVINVSSIYGSLGPDWSLYQGTAMGNPAAYGASKGGLEQLTRYLATTLGPDVRVNALSPGGVTRGQPASFSERYIARTPLRRMAVEEDFKGVVLFLASDLSAYVTGQIIMVDGGWSAW